MLDIVKHVPERKICKSYNKFIYLELDEAVMLPMGTVALVLLLSGKII